MFARKIRVIYILYVIFNVVCFYLGFYVNLIDNNVIYSEDYVYWEKAVLTEQSIELISSNIDRGTVIIRDKSTLYVHDPDLLIQQKALIEGRLFTPEEINNRNILPRLVTAGQGHILPDLASMPTNILGLFHSFRVAGQEISEVVPLNRFKHEIASEIYYVHGKESGQLLLSSIVGQDYFKPKEQVTLKLPSFELRPIIGQSIQFLFIVFNCLFYAIMYVFYTFYQEELVQFLLFSSKNPIFLVLIALVKSNYIAYSLLTLFITLIGLLIMNLSYTISMLIFIILNFWLSIGIITRLVFKRWLKNV